MKKELDEILWPTGLPFHLPENLIIVARRGSEAHGTYIPSTDPVSIDDRDIYGVVMPPLRFVAGLQKWEHSEAITGPWDVVLDELSKFVRLLTGQNPNVLQILYLREEDYLYRDLVLAPLLIENRKLFRARTRAFKSFVGYAQSQLHKMEHVRFLGYMGDKRKRLVEQFGYDCKNAAHLIRLLKMGVEYIETGELTVYREHDADQIKEIKRGGWRRERVVEYADELFQKCERAMESSALPDEIDQNAVTDLLGEMFRYRYDARGW